MQRVGAGDRRDLDLTLELAPDTTAPAVARRAVAARAAGHERTADLLLCVSEVVTNAVLHARTKVRVSVRFAGDEVRVEVSDDDPSPPVRKTFGGASVSGRGLHLLDRLTTGWGVDAGAAGKTVWFTFALR